MDLKKVLLILCITVVFALGLLSWEYWFLFEKIASPRERLNNSPPPPLQNTVNQNPPEADSQEPKKGLKNCFTEGKLASPTDTSQWELFEGLGFALRYPADAVAIVLKAPKGEVNAQINSLQSSHEAYITIYKLRDEVFRAHYLHASPVRYEFYSDSWWREEYVWDASSAEQCNPNSRGFTNNGKHPIYSVTDGDVGAFFTRYFVVFRNTEVSDHYEPLVVELTVYGDRNDEEYSTYPAFQNILENIIRTFEVRPTSRG